MKPLIKFSSILLLLFLSLSICYCQNITQLPINAHFRGSKESMSKLSRNSKSTYKLPPIDKVFYILSDTFSGIECHGDRFPNLPFDSLFNLETYNYRLPSINKYVSFIICDTSFSIYSNKNPTLYCRNFTYNVSAHLVLYDSLDKSARILPLLYWKSFGEYKRRTFDIDENFDIHLKDYTMADDYETFNSEEIPAFISKYDIKIHSKGEIEVKSPEAFEYDYYTKKIIKRMPSITRIYMPNGEIITKYK